MKRKPRADGRYQAQIRTGTIDGIAQYKYVYAASQKELNDKLAALRVEIGKGADLTQPMSLAFWIDRWLQRSAQTQTEEWHAVCEARADYWKDRIGREQIDRITTADLEDVLLELAKRNPKTGKPSGKKTLTEYASIIRRVFALAVQNRVLTFDPSLYLTIQKDAPRSRREALTDVQIAAIHKTPHECRLPCLIMIYTGVRIGELLALRKEDIHLEERWLHVRKAKTSAGVREVPIAEKIAPLIEKWLQKPCDSLICSAQNRPMSYDAFRDTYWDGVMVLLGMDHKPHDTRHTCVSLLTEAGVDQRIIRKIVGHKGQGVTEVVYTHVELPAKLEAINKI